MKVLEFREIRRGTLIGFASLELDSGLVLHDVALHKKGDARWVGLPSKPMIRDGAVMTGEDGKPRYQAVVEIPDWERKNKFNKQVWTAFEAFGMQGGAVNG